MDNAGQHENGSYNRMDNYNGMHGGQWNMAQFQTKESNASLMNKKMMKIMAEKEAAINELNRAISDKNYAFQQRNEAMKQRDEAISARDTARREKESAIASLRFQYSSSIVEAVPITGVVYSETPQSRHKKQTKKQRKSVGSSNKKGKKIVGEDLNRLLTTDGSKAEWESQDQSLSSQISYDKSTMATPVCSCTGQPRQCYKWGDGGWQSSCCTTNLSMFPLPHLENKRYSRMSGRKMSGNVFARLISRVAVDGHDLSMPVDLKDYWAKHGTNRYITIK